jgi:hypothetical protein
LLPEGADHDQALFHGVEEGGIVEAVQSSKENLPSNPCHFEGRQFELYCLVERIIANRVVTVSGGFGMGKSTLAVCAGRYLFERGHFSSVCYIKVRGAPREARGGGPLFPQTRPLTAHPSTRAAGFERHPPLERYL